MDTLIYDHPITGRPADPRTIQFGNWDPVEVDETKPCLVTAAAGAIAGALTSAWDTCRAGCRWVYDVLDACAERETAAERDAAHTLNVINEGSEPEEGLEALRGPGAANADQSRSFVSKMVTELRAVFGAPDFGAIKVVREADKIRARNHLIKWCREQCVRKVDVSRYLELAVSMYFVPQEHDIRAVLIQKSDHVSRAFANYELAHDVTIGRWKRRMLSLMGWRTGAEVAGDVRDHALPAPRL